MRGERECAVAAIHSAVSYVFRCLLPEEVPATDGCFGPDPRRRAGGNDRQRPPSGAVAGGNVETSQRIVDTLLPGLGEGAAREFRLPARAR